MERNLLGFRMVLKFASAHTNDIAFIVSVLCDGPVHVIYELRIDRIEWIQAIRKAHEMLDRLDNLFEQPDVLRTTTIWPSLYLRR